jgi:two-component system cell cycle response regulator CtrA
MLLLQIGDKPFRRGDDGADLARRGVRRSRVTSETEALEHLAQIRHDVVFIDIETPGINGCRLVSAIRQAKHDVPIFVFTSSPDLRAKIAILDLGADDVLTTSCPLDELLARVRAVLRRLDGHRTSTLSFDALEVRLDAREVRAHGAPVRLAPTEYQLVELLVRKRGVPVTKDACLNYIYGSQDQPDVKMIDVLTCRVRKKLAAAGVGHLIKSVWGMGYKLEADLPQLAAAA